MKYTLRTSRRADADIDRYVASIRRRVSPVSAAKWQAAILRRMQELTDHPEMWPIADEADDVGMELREIPHGRRRHVYRILFTIEPGHTVYVHRILYAAMDRLTADDL